VHFWISENDPTGTIGGPGSLYTNIVDTSKTAHIFASPTGLIVADEWQHVTLTFDRPSGMSMLFLNGRQVAWANLYEHGGIFTPFIPLTTANLYLGYRQHDWASGSDNPVFYSGLMDEPTTYNRALTLNEIFSIYSADFVGKDSIRPYFTTPMLPPATLATYTYPLAAILGTGPQKLFNRHSTCVVVSFFTWRGGGDSTHTRHLLLYSSSNRYGRIIYGGAVRSHSFLNVMHELGYCSRCGTCCAYISRS